VSWVAKFFLPACLSCVFLLFLNGPDIVTSHEARVAQPARLMAASGLPWSAKPAQVAPVHLRTVGGVVRLAPDWNEPPINVNPWLVPVLNGQFRLQKPPLPYWGSAIAIRIFGFSEWVVRLVPAVMGALATFLLFDLTRRLFGKEVAWCAALAWVSTYPIPEMYRKVMADPYLAFFTLLCVWAWVKAGAAAGETREAGHERGGKADTETRRHRDAETAQGSAPPLSPQSSVLSPDFPASPRLRVFASVVIFYVSLALALLAKGPVAVLDIFIPLAAYHWCFRRRLPGSFTSHAIGLLVLLAIGLPWPIYIWKNVPNVVEVWRYESFGELADNLENARSWAFYLPQLFYLAMPWTPLWVVGCILPFRKSNEPAIDQERDERSGAVPVKSDRRRYFALLWWGITVLFFSFVLQKKNQYLLPAIPAQAIITGQALAALLGWLRETRFKGLAGALAWTQAIVAVAFAIAIGVLIARVFDARRTGMLVGVAGAAVALVPLAMVVMKKQCAWLITQAISYSLLIVLVMHFYTTPLDDGRSPKPASRQMATLCRDPDYTVLVPKLPEEASVYLPIDLRYGFGHKVLAIVDDAHGVRQRAIAANPRPVPEPKLEMFAGWVPDAKVVSVRRLQIDSLPADYRWKVYELTVERRGLALSSPPVPWQ
jgi:4-amino-4-deoxy-L-arabinose transferase-like glycosyltransferase